MAQPGAAGQQAGVSNPNVSSMPSAEVMREFPLSARPHCPSVLIPFENALYALPVWKMNVHTEFHVSTAFVQIDALWKNVAKYDAECLLVLPLNGTVTKVKITLGSGGGEKLMETAVIPREELEAMQTDQPGMPNSSSSDALVERKESSSEQTPKENPYQAYIPNLFRLPIPGVKTGDDVRISISYLEPLEFSEGYYHFTLPLRLTEELIAEKLRLSDVLTITANINSVSDEMTYECPNYQMQTQPSNSRSRMVLRAKNIGVDPTTLAVLRETADFTLRYSIQSEAVMTALIKEESKDEYGDGTFLLFVTPPSRAPRHRYKRQVIFLLDRSGSMTGEPFEEAAKALTAALGTLEDNDEFGVVMFDHLKMHFDENLLPCTQANIDACSAWVRTKVPDGGGTDIINPLRWATEKLNAEKDETILPYVVLITDGAVANERQICKFAQDASGRARIMSLGIGFYCNWYFLKMLSQIGKGFSDVVVYRERIFPQVVHLMQSAATPIVTDISLKIGVDGGSSFELYPYPIPDLFLGAPLTIAGKYKGSFPASITLKGKTAGGAAFQTIIKTQTSPVIPVSKVFLKQRVDLLTARAWLQDSKKLKNEVTAVSCEQQIPCAYTTMVTYERKQGQPSIEEEHASMKKGGAQTKAWYRDKKKLGLLVAGNVAVVGALAFSFGDVGATLGNLPVIGTFGDGLLDIVDGGCLDCCGDDCFCDCGDCLAC